MEVGFMKVILPLNRRRIDACYHRHWQTTYVLDKWSKVEIIQGVLFKGGIVQRDICSRGYCPDGNCPEDIVHVYVIQWYILKWKIVRSGSTDAEPLHHPTRNTCLSTRYVGLLVVKHVSCKNDAWFMFSISCRSNCGLWIDTSITSECRSLT